MLSRSASDGACRALPFTRLDEGRELGNSKWFSQYAVPPTTIGICFLR